MIQIVLIIDEYYKKKILFIDFILVIMWYVTHYYLYNDTFDVMFVVSVKYLSWIVCNVILFGFK